MDPIMSLAREKGLWVVEDCAQANGAGIKKFKVQSSKFKATSNHKEKLNKIETRISNDETDSIRPVGSFGDVAAFSFCQDKIITTGGEGGMVTTNRHDIWDKIWSYKDHGKSFDAVYHREHQPGFRWLHESFGTNWRMT